MNQQEGCRCWMNTDDPTPPAITGRTHANWTHASSVEHSENTRFFGAANAQHFFDSIDHNIYMHK